MRKLGKQMVVIGGMRDIGGRTSHAGEEDEDRAGRPKVGDMEGPDWGNILGIKRRDQREKCA